MIQENNKELIHSIHICMQEMGKEIQELKARVYEMELNQHGIGEEIYCS